MNRRRWRYAVLLLVLLGVVAGVGVVGWRRLGQYELSVGSAPTNPATTPARVPPPASVTPTQTTTPRTTASPSTAQEQFAADTRVVTQNPLYRVGRMPASRCKEPTSRPTSLANVKAYYSQFVQCLDKAWAPVIRKAGFQFWAPRLEVFSGDRRPTLCALTDSAAYCGGVISMDADFDLQNYRRDDRLWTRTTMAFLIAHEYGHHIQRLTGILPASHTRELHINGIDAQLVESRRRELQASCLSGVYLGADRQYFPASGAWLRKWQFTVRNRGDEWNPQRTHGNKSNHSRWSRRGFDSADPGSCNTFAAKAATLS